MTDLLVFLVVIGILVTVGRIEDVKFNAENHHIELSWETGKDKPVDKQ